MSTTQSKRRYMLLEAPAPEFTPQVGWIYERRRGRKDIATMRLVELPSQEQFSTIFETEIPVAWLDRYFEEVEE